MAYRNLTNVFLMMRNNSVQNRQFYHEQQVTDQAALVEEGQVYLRNGPGDIALPPIWNDYLEECQYALRRLEEKIKVIDDLHKESIHRPNFDDCSGRQNQIDSLSREIGLLFQNCHKLVDNIRKQSNFGSVSERSLAQNAMASLVVSIQNQYNAYKKTQNNYLKSLNLREERSQKYLNSALEQEMETGQVDSELENIDLAFSSNSNRLTQTQFLQIEEDNVRLAEEREKQVKDIVRSIVDLNEIYKDLAHMVAEQGTILDRIDYNLERSSVQIYQGLKQLQQAERYQHKNAKMKCILGLAAVTFFMFILLVAVKFN